MTTIAEYIDGVWRAPSDREPDAIVTFSETDGPELPAGWIWWALGRIGTAATESDARRIAERVVAGRRAP